LELLPADALGDAARPAAAQRGSEMVERLFFLVAKMKISWDFNGLKPCLTSKHNELI
jgi:hypothetical protein